MALLNSLLHVIPKKIDLDMLIFGNDAWQSSNQKTLALFNGVGPYHTKYCCWFRVGRWDLLRRKENLSNKQILMTNRWETKPMYHRELWSTSGIVGADP